jgi:tRNA(fMet)-specific endonuclease VapC
MHGIRSRIDRHANRGIVVSVVTIAELACGSLKHANPEVHRRAWETFVAAFEVVTFDEAAARTHAEVRYALRSAPIGERDLLIAAIALPRKLVVVTHNLREFRRVPRLRVEDWVGA